MAVRIVTDSTSDLPSDIIDDLGITVVPLNVHFGAETYRDGVDITSEEFFRRLPASATLPKTSQPSVGAFIEAYTPLIDGGDEIVSIHISAKLSGTMNSARGAVEALRESPNPNARIELVDAEGAALWTGLVVMAAARAAKDGGSLEVVAQAARDAVAHMRLYFVLDTLEYLQKGGRIGKAQALVGSLLSIKPILTIHEGEVHPHERVRTRTKALARIRDLAAAEAPLAEIAICHSTTPDDADALANDLRPLVDAPVFVGRVGPVIGTYTGPGVLGLAMRKA